MSTKPLAIIAGAGTGTGLSIARRFAQAYNVIILSRSSASIDPIVSAVEASGGAAYGIPTDVSSEASVKAAFKDIRTKYPGSPIAAAVFNAGSLNRAPFLEAKLEDWDRTLGTQARGAFLFSQATIPLLLASKDLQHPPTLIFTGATASVKASVNFSVFAAGKWATRALSQSLAKEFGPQGVHVSHAIIDGVIDVPKTEEYTFDAEDAKISPDAIADAYWHLHTQPRTAFTWELDIRPYVERW
ncbi:NAD(P)-binding protein [Choiromyces venosus 120613-1]|uniref:NAD(P)-binding protein n=1 Tax=Choiromyces venosus 120613-1 TaxID=1336337 RepID=A0A3N4JB78_9PEZI|nr:NAD(P)-binding protein [Choiromyces venosus 120613-1]